MDGIARFTYEQKRKERREGILLMLVGVMFAAIGIVLWVVGNPWMGAIGISFGGMGILTGIITLTGTESPFARIAMIVACFLFALTSALMIASGSVASNVWGWRGGVAPIIAGALGFAFFGPGTVILIIKEIRRRRRRAR